MAKYRIKDICDSNLLNIRNLSGDVSINYLDTSSITHGVISEYQVLRLKEAPSRAQRMVSNGTIIYSLVRPNLCHYGYIDRPIDNLVVSTGFLTLNLKKSFRGTIDIKFLYLLLTQPSLTQYLHIIAQNAVSAYPSLTPSDLEGLTFDFPEYDVQKRISSLFFDIDSKIALNREINRNLEAIIKTITDYFLSSSQISKIYIKYLGDIKAGGDCPKTVNNVESEDFNIPIYSNGINYEGLYGYTTTTSKTVQARTLTIAARGTIGASFIRMTPYVPIIRLISIVPYDKGGDVWIHQMILRMVFEKNGSVQQQLTVPEVSNFIIPYPSPTVIQKYEIRTTPILEIIHSNKVEITRLQNIRDELLPLLMNGQVSVMPTAVNCDLSE